MSVMGPLDGIRVLELAQGVSGPFCGKLMAGLGASVVKVEPPDGDFARWLPPRVPASSPSEGSALFHHLNTSKKSITLDILRPEGRALLAGLIDRWADMVITSFSPSEAEELGLTFQQLSTSSPAIVVVSVTDFGDTGPYAGYVGSELAALALGGYLYLTGESDREPLKPWGYQAQYHAGLHASNGAVAAILRAEATGAGDQVDVSTVEAASFLASAAPGWAFFYKEEPSRVGNRLANLDPKQFYPSTMRPCRDGWVHAHGNIREPSLMELLMESPELSRPELVAEPKGHADEIDAIMDRWLAKHDRAEVVELAQTLRIPFTEVFTHDEVIDDPHLNGRGSFRSIEHPAIGVAKYPHAPIKFSKTPWSTDAAPLLGEHTDEVLSGILGLAAPEVGEIRSRGVA